MANSKRSKPQDRLSELPDSLIFHIFWFIPMSDVVRTTLLSKRFRNLWTTTPFLNFDSDTKVFRNFVNQVLFRWNGSRILKLKFKFDSGYEFNETISSDIDLWLNFAKEKKFEELYLHIESGKERCSVPRCLYSCSSLKVLSFRLFNFSNRKVQWNQLKSLTIARCSAITENVISLILSGSPLLEVLNLSFEDRGQNLNIRSYSLKELSICKYLSDRYDLNFASELTIWTPNLETLRIEGFPYTNCRLINVSSLTQAIIGFYGLFYKQNVDCNFRRIYFENGFLSSWEYIGDNFSQILQTIQHAESVTLFYCCLKVFAAMKMRCMHSSFPNVKSLKIGRCHTNYEQLVGLLQIFPQLKRLVLEDSKALHHKDDPKTLVYEANFPKSFLPQLRIIDVTWINDDGIFPVIEMILKYANKLEKMVFRVDRKIVRSPDYLLEASTKLMNMPRSSTNCTIDFLC